MRSVRGRPHHDSGEQVSSGCALYRGSRLLVRVIAIDGPAGAGKSTAAKALARRLHLPYLDTGAQFRAVGIAALGHSIDLDDPEAIAQMMPSLVLEVDDRGVRVDGRDVTQEIRTATGSHAASKVAIIPAVRTELARRQREWAEANGGGVVEGRDIGSVVFPDATLKLYITASPETRAARRSAETGEDEHEVLAAIRERDHRDKSREAAPLLLADGATRVDTSGLTIDEVVDHILALLAEAEGGTA
jgi:CMP/dCMP kinase